MAVTANQPIRATNPHDLISTPVIASTTLYQGTLAFAVAASGHASNVIAAGANSFLGIVKSEADNSTGAAAAIQAEIYTKGIFELQGSSFTQALVGDLIYAVDNFTVNATSSSQSLVGKCVGFVSTTKILVDIGQRAL
jgi:predicted RecA/RadA family phage recombinase